MVNNDSVTSPVCEHPIDSNDVNCFSLFKMNVFVTTVRGEWTPLVVLAEQCGYSVDSHSPDIVFAAPFITCGITVKVNIRKKPCS